MTGWHLALVVAGVGLFGIGGFYFGEMRFRVRCYRVRQELREIQREALADVSES